MTRSGGGTIFYTLDRSDPRAVSGGLGASARTYTAAVSIGEPVTVKARVRQGGTWSALNEASFTILRDLTSLVINEIMYHPGDL